MRCKNRSHRVQGYVYLDFMLQNSIRVTYVASIIGQGLDGSWGRGRSVCGPMRESESLRGERT